LEASNRWHALYSCTAVPVTTELASVLAS
jgi:hypothetical protein